MAKAKHTPGPWFLDREVKDYGNQSPDAPLLGTVIGDGAHIAVITSDLVEAEANARLIAAAPELLDALREIADAVPAVYGGTQGAIRDRALAAIAKAEGR